ncbi:MAG: carbohydrate ABC transporter permease [Thermomicrobiales bacterium]
MVTSLPKASAPTAGNAERARRRPRISGIVTHLILLATVVLSLYPFALMLMNSFKSNTEVLQNPAGWPRQITLESYRQLVNYQGNEVFRSFFNSVFIATVSTILAVVLAGMAAFAFAKLSFRGRDVIFGMLLATLMVPGEVTLPPLYIMFARIGWLNSYQVQIIPSVASVFGLFMIRQYMLSLPSELLEAARLDGANIWQQLWQIVMPLSTPVLGAFAILHFIGRWNDYLWPLVVVTDPKYRPIMAMLPTIKDPLVGFFTPWGMLMAGCVIVTIPLIVVFLLFQDKFLSGVVIGATKG